jgi:hypothetical protein
MTEPTYQYVKGQGWVISTGPLIYQTFEYQGETYYIVDLADVPSGVPRSFAPWHPDYDSGEECAPNDLRKGFNAVIEHVKQSGVSYSAYSFKSRNQHICAIFAADYGKLYAG